MTSVTEINQLLNTVPDYIQKVQCDTNQFSTPFKCAVKSCPNYFEKFDRCTILPYKFHRFPTDKKLRKLWKLKCGLQKTDHVKGLMVCSVHFNLDDYIRNYKEEFKNPNFKRLLSTSAVPKHKLGPNQNVKFEDISDTEYQTDIESYYEPTTNGKSKTEYLQQQFFGERPTEYKFLAKRIELKSGPLDLNEVKSEVDLNKELEETNKKLQANIKRCKSRINKINKSIKTARVKAIRVKERNRTEEDKLHNIFSKAQINVLLGKKAIWTNDDLGTAFTMRHLGSKKCYLYMKNVLKIPLPSLSCVQKWAASKAQNDM